MSLQLHIDKQQPVRVPTKRLHRLCRAVLEGERKRRWQGVINLVFTDDRYIADLNTQFRGKAIATDVLSFSIDPPVSTENVFGEIYISAPTARRQARQYGGTIFGEYLRLFCHGLLHLLGYDHDTDRAARRMANRERRYLKAAGEEFIR